MTVKSSSLDNHGNSVLSSKHGISWKWLVQLTTQTLPQMLFLWTNNCTSESTRNALCLLSSLPHAILKRLGLWARFHKINNFYCSSSDMLKWNWFLSFFLFAWLCGSEEYDNFTQMSTLWSRQITSWNYEQSFDLANTFLGSQGPQGSIDLTLRPIVLEKWVLFHHLQHL